MPTTRRTYRKKRSYKRTKRNYKKKASVSVVRTPTAFPDRVFTKLKHTQTHALSGAANYAFGYQLNNMYDPYVGVGGGQPRGFDQWATVYQVYKVHAVKVRCSFFQTTAIPVILASTAGRNSGALTTVKDICEHPYATYRRSDIQKTTAVVNKFYSVKKVMGEKTLDDVWQSDVGGAPTSVIHGQFTTLSVDEGTTHTGQMLVEIWFMCEFRERKRLPQS